MLNDDEQSLKEIVSAARSIALDIRDQGFEPEEIVLASLLAQLTDAASGILSELARKETPKPTSKLDKFPGVYDQEATWANYPELRPKPDKATVPVNIMEYINRPELIQHVDGRLVKSIERQYCGEYDGTPMCVGFKGGVYEWYPENAKQFVLIDAGKRIVGWRRKVQFKNGNVMTTALFMPTKEAFDEAWKNYKTFGEWEKLDELIEE